MLWTKNPVLAETVQTRVSLWDMSNSFTATVAPQKTFRILGCAEAPLPSSFCMGLYNAFIIFAVDFG